MLFDVEADPAEKHELSESNPGIVTTMLNRLNFYQNRVSLCANGTIFKILLVNY